MSAEDRALEDYFSGLLKEAAPQEAEPRDTIEQPAPEQPAPPSKPECSAEKISRSIKSKPEPVSAPLRPLPKKKLKTDLKQNVTLLKEDQLKSLQQLLLPPIRTIEATLAQPVEEPENKKADTQTPPKNDPKEEFDLAGEQAAEPINEPLIDEEVYSTSWERWKPNGRPGWAQEPFDVLIVKVSGLSLAVPLITLGQIFPLTDDLTPIFGRAPWFMGLLPTPVGKLSTINSALYVMPERYQSDQIENYQYAVSLANSDWALAVDSVNQPSRLQPDDVTWRADRKTRPWLAGTVKSAMCALVDIPRLKVLLTKANSGKL